MTAKETLLGINPAIAIKLITRKREINNAMLDSNFEQALKIQDMNFKNYQKAYELEKRGDLIKAAKLYWKNIYKNGSDAPANFNRLLIVLDKLKHYEDELRVAEVFIVFVSEEYIDKLKKRIERLKKKI